jgi:hypothetical protein
VSSKYAGIIDDLPALPTEDPSYQEKVNEVKASIRAEHVHVPESLAKEYQIVRTAKEDLAEELALIQLRLTAVEQLLIEAYENDEPGFGLYGAGPNTVKMANGASVAIQLEPCGKVEDRDRFRLWCVANGLENSLQLHAGTMNSITKERLLEGKDAPDGVKAYVRPKIVWRKG